MRRLVQELLGLGDADSMRRALLRELMKASGVSIGLSHGLVVDPEGELRVVDVLTEGIAGTPPLADLEGRSFSDLGASIASMLMDGVAFGRFTAVAKNLEFPPVPARLWEPLGAHSAFAMNLAHDGIFVAHISLVRTEAEPPATPADLVSLRSWPKVVEQVHLAAAARSERRSEGASTFVIDHEGHPTLSAGQPRHWQDAEMRKAILSLVETLDTQSPDAEPVDGYFEGALIRGQRLRGVEREDGYLIRVAPARPWPVPPVLELPPMSRKVAALAARGATAADIAETLGRSQDTIRTHLRRAYETLGISSRTELTQIIGQLGVPNRAGPNRS